ncbi:MAG TPA: APC family permease [Bacteroidia bacterium]|nr:APC family permease [Bacteroidia bacterium]
MLKQENTIIKPQLKSFDLTIIVVSLVIGMGIFRTPVEVANKAVLPEIFFLAWITGAVVSLIGALTFAEIGSRHPAAGGFYKIFSVCYTPVFAFMVNWITVISNAVSTAAVAIMGAEYMVPLLFPQMNPDVSIKIITISSLGLLYGINMLGIKISSRVLNVLIVLKLTLLLILISAQFFVEPLADIAAPLPARSDEFNWWHAFLLCFVPVFFTYGGYQQTMNFGSDVKEPRKTMPRSIGIGIAIVLIAYLCVNYSYFKVLGFEGLKQSTTLAADITGMMFGNMAHKLVSVMMFLSVMAYVNVSLISNPRIYYAMAEDKVMPAVFQRVNKKTQVQEWGVTLFCIIIFATLFFLTSFQRILEYVMFFDSISIITAAAAIFILRNRAKSSGVPEGIYKMKGYPYLPAFFILIYGGVNVSVFLANPEAFLYGFLLFISGFPLFHLVRMGLKKSSAK